MTFVGRIHVKQEDPPFLSRCIQDRDNNYGIELRNEGTTRVKYEEADRAFFYDLPSWVSLARSWDDLDRFLREYNEYLVGPSRNNKERSYVSLDT